MSTKLPLITEPEVFIKLPYPPSVNHCYGHCSKQGKAFVFLHKKGKEYFEKVSCEIVAQKIKPIKDAKDMTVQIVANTPDKRVRDVDNILKLALDSLKKAGVVGDDRYFNWVIVGRGEVDPTGEGSLEVSIWKGKSNGVS